MPRLVRHEWEIDPETGLSKLQEGYFWRITKPEYDFGLDEVQVELRAVGKNGKSTLIKRKLARPRENSILRASWDILDELRGEYYPDIGEKFYGDYPPSKL